MTSQADHSSRCAPYSLSFDFCRSMLDYRPTATLDYRHTGTLERHLKSTCRDFRVSSLVAPVTVWDGHMTSNVEHR